MTRAAVAAIILVAGLAVVSCSREGALRYKGIKFKAQSTGFVGAQTRTSYSGALTGGVERIDWEEGDVFRVCSDKAYVLGEPSRHWSDFKVVSKTGEGAVSTATIMPATDPNSLQWGDGDHTFWAMYPKPEGTNSFNEGTMVFTMPATQSKTLDMTIAPMLAVTADVPANSSSVALAFTPKYTAFQFSISKSSYTTINLTSFKLTATTGNLTGTYTIAAADYSAEPDFDTNVGQTISVDLTGTTLNSGNENLTLTVMGIPQTVSGLTIEFKGTFDGAAQTRQVTLKQADGSALEFLPYKKYSIYGLKFPMLTDVTIPDSITWDGTYSSEAIADDIAWEDKFTADGGIADDIEWPVGTDGDAVTGDNVNWSSAPGLCGPFAGLYLSKGYLALTGAGTYGLSGDDQLGILQYYNTEDVSGTPRHYLCSGDLPGTSFPGYAVPSPEQWASILGTSRTGAHIFYTPAADRHYYAKVTVDLAETTYASPAGDGKIKGLLLFPDGKEISIPEALNITVVESTSTTPGTITYEYLGDLPDDDFTIKLTHDRLEELSSAGCAFLPCAGGNEGGSWAGGGSTGRYRSSTASSGAGFSGAEVSPSATLAADDYYPVRLVKIWE